MIKADPIASAGMNPARADFTVFNPENYRYFPAMPRQIYVGVTLDLQGVQGTGKN